MSAPAEKQSCSSSRIALLALACLLAASVADVTYVSHQLPERVATHFDLHGHANGWMSRAQYVKFTCILGVTTPLFVVGVFAVTRRLRGWGLNIPNKAYWLDPEREQGTLDFLQRQGFWFATLMVAFHAGLFHAVVAANSGAPAVLATTHIGLLTAGFLAGVTVWIVALLVRFRRPTR